MGGQVADFMQEAFGLSPEGTDCSRVSSGKQTHAALLETRAAFPKTPPPAPPQNTRAGPGTSATPPGGSSCLSGPMTEEAQLLEAQLLQTHPGR